jgi:hypothetical protein
MSAACVVEHQWSLGEDYGLMLACLGVAGEDGLCEAWAWLGWCQQAGLVVGPQKTHALLS